jgi:hypothetical protein
MGDFYISIIICKKSKDFLELLFIIYFLNLFAIAGVFDILISVREIEKWITQLIR